MPPTVREQDPLMASLLGTCSQSNEGSEGLLKDDVSVDFVLSAAAIFVAPGEMQPHRVLKHYRNSRDASCGLTSRMNAALKTSPCEAECQWHASCFAIRRVGCWLRGGSALEPRVPGSSSRRLA